MIYGILAAIFVFGFFSYFVYKNEKRKKKANNPAPKEKKQKAPKEPKEKKQKAPKEPKEPKRKKHHEKEDTDTTPNYDAIDLTGKIDDSPPPEIARESMSQNEPRKASFMQSKLTELFDDNKSSSPREKSSLQTRSGSDPLRDVNFGGERRGERSSPPPPSSSRSLHESILAKRAAARAKNPYNLQEEDKDVNTMIDELPPEIKAMLFTDVLKRRDDI